MAATDLESAALDRKAKLQALRRKRDGEVATDVALADEMNRWISLSLSPTF